MLHLPIYLDYHATTPVDRRVLEAMLPFFSETFGNASSRNHPFGWAAGKAVERARHDIADLLGAGTKEIVFTSGATESNNLAILGTAHANHSRDRHIVTVVTEHHAVLDPCAQLETQGWRVSRLGVGPGGLIDLDALDEILTDRTLLVSVMAVNNETGVIQPLGAIAERCARRGALLHTDASQAVGRIPFEPGRLPVDLASFTAHKFYGPKGVGALYVRRRQPRLNIDPIVYGGGHERGLRSGTLNVPGIVGFGAAAALAARERGAESQRIGVLRDRLHAGLEARLGVLGVNGDPTRRLPHTLNVSIPDVDGVSLHRGLDDIAVSAGAACTTDSGEPSHVLAAMGVSPELARATIRFGLGRFTTADEIDYAIEKVSAVVEGLRDAQTIR